MQIFYKFSKLKFVALTLFVYSSRCPAYSDGSNVPSSAALTETTEENYPNLFKEQSNSQQNESASQNKLIFTGIVCITVAGVLAWYLYMRNQRQNANVLII